MTTDDPILGLLSHFSSISRTERTSFCTLSDSASKFQLLYEKNENNSIVAYLNVPVSYCYDKKVVMILVPTVQTKFCIHISCSTKRFTLKRHNAESLKDLLKVLSKKKIAIKLTL